jgi:hypothetical protein
MDRLTHKSGPTASRRLGEPRVPHVPGFVRAGDAAQRVVGELELRLAASALLGCLGKAAEAFDITAEGIEAHYPSTAATLRARAQEARGLIATVEAAL